jgi:hypothetical protein
MPKIMLYHNLIYQALKLVLLNSSLTLIVIFTRPNWTFAKEFNEVKITTNLNFNKSISNSMFSLSNHLGTSAFFPLLFC